MSTETLGAKPAQPKATPKQGCLTLFVLVAVIAIIAAIAGGSSSSGAKYTANFQAGGLQIIDPAEITVYITVHNVGTGSGTPTCTIDLSSPGGAYTGFDGLTPDNPIAAGHQASFSDTITVTGQGAAYVSRSASSVSCS